MAKKAGVLLGTAEERSRVHVGSVLKGSDTVDLMSKEREHLGVVYLPLVSAGIGAASVLDVVFFLKVMLDLG